MSSSLARLVKQTGLYALSSALIKASGILLAPLYLNTAYLSQEAFGQLALLEVTGQFGILVASLGIGWGLLKFLTDPKLGAHHGALPFTALLGMTTSALAVTGLFWIGAPAFARFVLEDPALVGSVRLLGFYVCLKIIGQVPYTLLRERERAGRFVIVQLGEAAVLILGYYYFLVARGWGLEGVMYAYVVSAGAGTAVLLLTMLLRVERVFRGRLLGRILQFGWPLVVANLAALVLRLGDRYLLNALMDAEAVALYEWAARMSNTISMLFVQSFQLAFSVIGLKSLGAGERSLHRRTFRHYVLWTGWAVLGLSLLAYDLVEILLVRGFNIDVTYLQADPLILPLALGFMTYGVYVVVNNVLYAEERTRVIGANVLMAAVLNVALNLVLIPTLGIMGAALATLAAYLVLAVQTARVAEREVRIGYPWSVYGIAVVLIVGLYVLTLPTKEWATGPRLAARGAAILAYPPLLVAFRLYSVQEVRRGLAFVRNRAWRTGGGSSDE